MVAERGWGGLVACPFPACTPRTREHPREQQAGKVLAGEGWKISTLDILMLVTSLPPPSPSMAPGDRPWCL